MWFKKKTLWVLLRANFHVLTTPTKSMLVNFGWDLPTIWWPSTSKIIGKSLVCDYWIFLNFIKPPRDDLKKQSKWPWNMIHLMPCRNPCRLYIHLAFTYSVGPSSVVWSSELGPAPPFPPMRVLEMQWSRALSLVALGCPPDRPGGLVGAPRISHVVYVWVPITA